MKVKPLENRILIKPREAEEKTEGGIYLPDSAKEKTHDGTVVAVGEGKDNKKLPVSVGDKVMYEKYGGTTVKLDGKEHILMDVKDVLAIIE
ncbi:MAG: co-chaperone GroES [Candidatus Aenigmarchaeota archaeon]|nr:co-chaperone GroES [Candidatus Aenigmarchaeota archaeon]MCK5233793.1 co-chaperone GroES [Candidatus Aenigmarchaeota archaeon]MCK5333935.1 co-chaperone GroES [Candidatus Aenigmarchaeota archaeon]